MVNVAFNGATYLFIIICLNPIHDVKRINENTLGGRSEHVGNPIQATAPGEQLGIRCLAQWDFSLDLFILYILYIVSFKCSLYYLLLYILLFDCLLYRVFVHAVLAH